MNGGERWREGKATREFVKSRWVFWRNEQKCKYFSSVYESGWHWAQLSFDVVVNGGKNGVYGLKEKKICVYIYILQQAIIKREREALSDPEKINYSSIRKGLEFNFTGFVINLSTFLFLNIFSVNIFQSLTSETFLPFFPLYFRRENKKIFRPKFYSCFFSFFLFWLSAINFGNNFKLLHFVFIITKFFLFSIAKFFLLALNELRNRFLRHFSCS